MAAFDFPSSPSVNQTYTANGVTWKWNGTMWMRVSGAGYLEKIEEGNSKVEVDDSGSGNVTVTTDGTEKLRIDSSGNLGLGTQTPNKNSWNKAVTLEGSSNCAYEISDNGTLAAAFALQGNDRIELMNFRAGPLTFKTQNTERLRIDSDGRLLLGLNASAGGNAIFQVHGSGNKKAQFHQPDSGNCHIQFTNTQTGTSSNNGVEIGLGGDEQAQIWNYYNSYFRIGTNGSERLRIDSSGRLGLGVVPEAYHANNKAVIRGDSGYAILGRGDNALNISQNFYYDSSDAGKYIANGEASVYQQADGSHRFYSAASGSANASASMVERLRIDSNGRMGINTDPTSYANTDSALGLVVNNGHSSSDHTFLDIRNGTSESGRIRFVDGDNGIGGQIYFAHNTARGGVGGNCMGFFTANNVLRFQVTTTGAKVQGNTDGVLELDTTDTRGTFIRYQENGTTKVWAGCSEGIGSGGNEEDFGIRATRDIRFRTGSSNSMRLTAAGYLQVASDGNISGDNENIFQQHQTTYNVLQLRAETSSYQASGGGALAVGVIRSASSSYVFAGWYSGNNSSNFQDRKFSFRGDGQGYADGAWNGGGADYAEYFEWSDGNTSSEDRRGISVVLDGDKIREATSGEDPIGVISANPSVVGDADDLQWKNKYLRTEYGSFDLDENGEQKLNPDYNPNQEYVSRENRPEWDCVGLMGKLRIRKGQITGSRWIKMRDVSVNVEEWLVR